MYRFLLLPRFLECRNECLAPVSSERFLRGGILVGDFRLSRRRIGPGERADGVVLFERPPYKRSTETLFLQMAESGAVDKPALAPIGFGVSTLREAANHAH